MQLQHTIKNTHPTHYCCYIEQPTTQKEQQIPFDVTLANLCMLHTQAACVPRRELFLFWSSVFQRLVVSSSRYRQFGGTCLHIQEGKINYKIAIKQGCRMYIRNVCINYKITRFQYGCICRRECFLQ